jgi:8-oxo-dGTP pyrophosphatase MutT (NUDIX family)
MSDDPATAKPSDLAAKRTDRLNDAARNRTFANLRPRDAATLILVDRAESVPKVLLGRRHESHKFLPGKFVFPGGRLEITDRLMPIAAPLHARDTERLMRRLRRPSPAKAAGLALAAIRETYEETGLMLGARTAGRIAAPAGAWQAFAQAGIMPDLSAIHFIARAITPPGRPRRFDSRFFAADVSAVAHRANGFFGPEAELVELIWLPITEARRLDIPTITAVALEELQERIATGMSHDHPVPFYRMLHNRFVRENL